MPDPLDSYASPVGPSATFGRIDQGVDYDSREPYYALGSGVVSHISGPGSWAGGTGEAVYITLDKPVEINGRIYTQVYYAEEHPLVAMGARVLAGQAVMAAGGAEIGFAQGNEPTCALVGGLGAGTQPTVCGRDFLETVNAVKRHLATTAGKGVPKIPRKVIPTPTAPETFHATSLTQAFVLLQGVLGVSLPSLSRECVRYARAAVRAAAPPRRVR